jgi:hypothetical protein
MSEIVLRSQQRNSKYFNVPDQNKVDPLKPAPNISILGPASYDLSYVSPIGTPSLGTTSIFMIPQNLASYLYNIFVEIDITAPTTGSLCYLVAWSAIERVEIRHGSNQLMLYDYANVMNYLMDNLITEQVKTLSLSAGGFSTPTGTNKFCAPIMTFFDTLARANEDKFVPPLNMNLLAAPLEVRITWRPPSKIKNQPAHSDDAKLNSVRLYCLHGDADEKVKQLHMNEVANYKYFGVDFQTPQNSAGITPNAVNVQYDVSSVYGCIEALHFKLFTSDQLTLNNLWFFGAGFPTASQLLIDGRPFFEVFSAATEQHLQAILQAFNPTQTFDPNAKSGFLKQFALLPDSLGLNSGSLCMDSINKLVLQFSNNADTNIMTCVAIVQAIYEIRNGIMVRIN